VSWGQFIGIGVSDYDQAHERLEHAVAEVEAFRALFVAGLAGLDQQLDGEALGNPTETEAQDRLKALEDSMPDGGPLVVLWSGHGLLKANRLRLLGRDSGSSAVAGLDAIEVAAYGAVSGANQLLFIIDTCFSAGGVPAGTVATQVLQEAPPEGEHVWVGVLASCLATEKARDGLFGQRLQALLKDGPTAPELRVRWSPHSQYIRGDDLCDALLKSWVSDRQSPDFQSRGSAWWMFPNPLYDPGAPEQVVEHLLLAARGGASPEERSWFTGRISEVDQVVAWVQARQPGVYVVTGSAGTGKSAIVGRVVSLSNPEERGRLLAEGRPWTHADPGERSVQAHVHARGLTADRAADQLADQLVHQGALAPQETRRNASELIGQVQRAVEDNAPPPVLVVDGLDEARAEAFTVAEDLLVRLGRYAVVVVSTREVHRGHDQPSLVSTLAPRGPGLDLDDPAEQQRGRVDLHGYITARLAGVDPGMDPAAVAGYLAGEASMTGSRPFLLGRLVTDQLRATPIDTSQAGWQDQISDSIEAALDADLGNVDAPTHRPVPEDWTPAGLARALLTALTRGFGAGFPEEEWLAAANAIGPDVGFDREDITWVLDQLGRYIMQDGEGGVAVYRQAHQSLAEHLRPAYQGTPEQPFDPQAAPVAVALLDRYHTLVAGGVPADAPTYLWRYAWRHAAAAGPEGLQRLRTLAASEPALVQDVAMAALEIAGRFRYWGRRQDAVGPSEEAVGLYRELAAANPAFQPDLAGALGNLDRVCREIGTSDRASRAWQAVLSDAQPHDVAFLLLARARAADPGHSDAVTWLAEALTLAESDRTLTAAVHEEARRHRSRNQDAFDAAWTQ
jgi:hypothetical protein